MEGLGLFALLHLGGHEKRDSEFLMRTSTCEVRI